MHSPRNALITGSALLALLAGCVSGVPTATPATPALATPTTRATTPGAPPTTSARVVPAATTPAATTTAARTTPAPPPGPTCRVDLGAGAIAAAVARLGPAFADPADNHPWARTADGGNYDPCAALSAASVTIQGATGSSPEQVLLFHEGVYQGTGTLKAYGFTMIDVAASTDDTVVVVYGYEKPGESTASASGRVTVRYRWVHGAVRMLDTLPPQITR